MKELNVDYGTRVQANQILATLEIPELQSQLKQDDAAIKNASDQITHAQNELSRMEAQHKVMQLQFDRLDSVAKSKPGLVAQQEVDDARRQGLGFRGASGGGQIESAVGAKPARGRSSQAGTRSGAVRLLEDHGAVRRRRHAALSPIWARWCRPAPVPARRRCRWSGSRRTICSGW